MQDDFDKIRLDHILIINDLVYEYKEKTGQFPLENYSVMPVYVVIATEEQIKNDKGRSNVFLDLSSRSVDGKVPEQPKSIEKITLKEFETILEKGLQRKVTYQLIPRKYLSTNLLFTITHIILAYLMLPPFSIIVFPSPEI